MSLDWWVWPAFVGSVGLLLALDLFVFHRRAHVVSLREAGLATAVWVTLGLSFGVLIWFWWGAEAAGEYLAGYLIEESLSVDNVFVFTLLFSYFAVPAAYQHRVLFWGVVGAVVFRLAFILAGVALLEHFHWIIYLFGVFLVYTGIKMARHEELEVHPENNPVLRLVGRLIPITPVYHGQQLFVRLDGRLWATPLFAVLVVVETTDVLFAVDSIPAVFAVTRDPFLVFSSNVFAVLGLRSLYFLLAGMMDRFAYLKVGVAALLVFVGAKILVSDVLHLPIWASLAAIVLILGTAILASLWRQSAVAARAAPAPREVAEGAPATAEPSPGAPRAPAREPPRDAGA